MSTDKISQLLVGVLMYQFLAMLAQVSNPKTLPHCRCGFARHPKYLFPLLPNRSSKPGTSMAFSP